MVDSTGSRAYVISGLKRELFYHGFGADCKHMPCIRWTVYDDMWYIMYQCIQVVLCVEKYMFPDVSMNNHIIQVYLISTSAYGT